MTRVACLVACLIACMVACAAGLLAQQPAGVIDGVITGSVRDSVTKAALPDVEVSLDGPGVQSTVKTDAQGVFRFEHLAGGRYHVGYDKQGYMTSEAGKPIYIPINIKDGAVAGRLIIDLTPTAEVEGVVLDEEGRPMPGVLVYSPNGDSPAPTDEAGRYRLEIFIPRPGRIELRMPYSLRRSTIRRDPETGEIFGYVNTQYYPGVSELRMAALVDFAPGVHLRGFDIRLRRMRLVTFGGYALDLADGRKLADLELAKLEMAKLEIELSPEGSPLPDETFQRRPAGAGGTFRFDLIQPGSYALLVFRGSHRGDPNALPYVTTVDVPNTGVEDLRVPVPAFVPIRGVIATAKPGWTGQVEIALRDATGPGRTREFVVHGGAEFSLDAVPPGRWRFEVHSTARTQDGAQALPVTGVRFGNQQFPEPFLVAESGNPPLEISLSDQTGTVAGTVVDEHRQPVGGALIVVRQPGGSTAIGRAFRSRADGSFRGDDIAPGNYEVSAWVEGRPGIDAAPKRNGRAAKVEVKAGETAVVRLVVDLM